MGGGSSTSYYELGSTEFVWEDSCGSCPNYIEWGDDDYCNQLSTDDGHCFRGPFGSENSHFTVWFELPSSWTNPVDVEITTTFWAIGDWETVTATTGEEAFIGHYINNDESISPSLRELRYTSTNCSGGIFDKWVYPGYGSFNAYDWEASYRVDSWDAPCFITVTRTISDFDEQYLKLIFGVYNSDTSSFGLSNSRTLSAFVIQDLSVSFLQTSRPTVSPTVSPTPSPSVSPTLMSAAPTENPTFTRDPSQSPTLATSSPTEYPTLIPTRNPSESPTAQTSSPTASPSPSPSLNPTSVSSNPTMQPSMVPSTAPIKQPSHSPTAASLEEGEDKGGDGSSGLIGNVGSTTEIIVIVFAILLCLVICGLAFMFHQNRQLKREIHEDYAGNKRNKKKSGLEVQIDAVDEMDGEGYDNTTLQTLPSASVSHVSQMNEQMLKREGLDVVSVISVEDSMRMSAAMTPGHEMSMSSVTVGGNIPAPPMRSPKLSKASVATVSNTLADSEVLVGIESEFVTPAGPTPSEVTVGGVLVGPATMTDAARAKGGIAGESGGIDDEGDENFNDLGVYDQPEGVHRDRADSDAMYEPVKPTVGDTPMIAGDHDTPHTPGDV